MRLDRSTLHRPTLPSFPLHFAYRIPYVTVVRYDPTFFSPLFLQPRPFFTAAHLITLACPLPASPPALRNSIPLPWRALMTSTVRTLHNNSALSVSFTSAVDACAHVATARESRFCMCLRAAVTIRRSGRDERLVPVFDSRRSHSHAVLCRTLLAVLANRRGFSSSLFPFVLPLFRFQRCFSWPYACVDYLFKVVLIGDAGVGYVSTFFLFTTTCISDFRELLQIRACRCLLVSDLPRMSCSVNAATNYLFASSPSRLLLTTLFANTENQTS